MNAEDYYKADCGNHELLTHAQEIDLIIRAQAGDCEAEEALVRGNQRLVYLIAIRYLWSAGDQELCDLIQYGNLGMLAAIRRFDIRRRVRFSTYAYWWIRQAICRNSGQLGHGLSISYNSLEVKEKMRRHRSKLYQTLKREPSMQEISSSSGVSLQRLEQVKNATRPVLSLEDLTALRELETGEYGGDGWGNGIASADGKTETEADNRWLAEQALGCLDTRQAAIIRLKFFDGFSLAQIGERLGLTKERVRQIQNKAIERMRRKLLPQTA